MNTKPDSKTPWNPIFGIFTVLVIYALSQIVGLYILIFYSTNFMHLSVSQATNWGNSSIFAQFFYVLIVEILIVLAVLGIIKLYKAKPNIIGLRRPKISDPIFGISAIPLYYIIYFIAVAVVSSFYAGLNVSQKQDIGFNTPHGFFQLLLTFISLVVLPPIAEEILVRGFLYSSLKRGFLALTNLVRRNKSNDQTAVKNSRFIKVLPMLLAGLFTSLIFASAHLPEGSGGLLWIGFIDTFILSVVLVFLREKTNGLWAGMTLHGIKNLIAYYLVFIAPLVTYHI
jgi:membrane protease YdiL (CAAX protease family)